MLTVIISHFKPLLWENDYGKQLEIYFSGAKLGNKYSKNTCIFWCVFKGPNHFHKIFDI